MMSQQHNTAIVWPREPQTVGRGYNFSVIMDNFLLCTQKMSKQRLVRLDNDLRAVVAFAPTTTRIRRLGVIKLSCSLTARYTENTADAFSFFSVWIFATISRIRVDS